MFYTLFLVSLAFHFPLKTENGDCTSMPAVSAVWAEPPAMNMQTHIPERSLSSLLHEPTDLSCWCWANPAAEQRAWWRELQRAGTVPSALPPGWNIQACIKRWTRQTARPDFVKQLRSVPFKMVPTRSRKPINAIPPPPPPPFLCPH